MAGYSKIIFIRWFLYLFDPCPNMSWGGQWPGGRASHSESSRRGIIQSV